MGKTRRNTRSMRESSNDMFLSQDQPGPSSQIDVLSQRSSRNTSLRESQMMGSQDLDTQEKMQLVSSVIRYLFAADKNKQPIQKAHIVKNVLNGSNKLFHTIMEKVNRELFEVFGFELVEIENNRYILANKMENNLPHLIFQNSNKQVLLYLVLVHIFMHGEACQEDMLWNFLRSLGIITNNSFQNEYFGDVKQLVTVDFVNERYLEKKSVDKNDQSRLEYIWGARAENELTYRSVLQFVADIYGVSPNNWKLQYKVMSEQERNKK
ncbi:non-structural maintenance of chromosomes element 3 homolog [Nylanderia fulva]|uniref:non-structural maintenance of chromosomes element 3 homolog n=1 Tax=Nylanderia fulva TaxID=613905 RepID=UPI0010FACF7A|nr:non-structural maintenance of chromosomes element 3 homolog [Nylanderia fulva]XP_029175686.1 non-structural maintenance of chromosomes element 3 homolog [Nylanderia fulva]XP_029175687.1 non-structural maintenance of chromosomes element 3 homolog [Nylanderia fulva]XP_029175688.1 non-structural maintenance of chromosomes element 3 homolog [Nylanderia fulva]